MLHCVHSSFLRGIALITVLLFLQIITLLGLYALSVCLLSQKINAEDWQKQVGILRAEELLRLIIMRLQGEIPPCIVAKGSAIKVLTQLERFPAVCKGYFHELQYYYVVEQMGEDPCAQLVDVNMGQFAAHYFRLTMLVVVEKINTKVILQGTFVKPLNRIEECRRVSYPLSVGQQV